MFDKFMTAALLAILVGSLYVGGKCLYLTNTTDFNKIISNR